MAEILSLPSVSEHQIAESDRNTAYEVISDSAPVHGVREPVGYATAIPEKLSIDAHVMIVNGYFAFKQTSTAFAKELASQGIPVTTFSPGRVHSEKWKALQHLRDPQQLHVACLAGVDNHIRSNIAYARTPNGEQVARAPRIIIGHSMGIMAAVRYAEAYPDRVASVVSLEGVGQQGPLGVVSALTRTAQVAVDVGVNAARGKFNNYGLNALGKAVYHAARNPVRTGAEGISCMYADTRPHVSYLASLGINYFIVTGELDSYFPPAEVEPVVRGSTAAYSEMPDATHIAPQVRPQETAHHLIPLIS